MSIATLTGCKTTRSTSEDPTAGTDQEKPRPKTETAKINAQLGIAYLEEKNVQRAKQKLLLALQQGPDMPETWYSMAYFLEATGNTDEARKYYLKSVAIDPKRGDAQNNYGTFLCRSGQYQESIKHFMLAANSPEYLDPAAAYENAGLCAMKNNSYKQAAGYFNQALLKDPARTISLLKTAEADVKMGNYKEAKAMLMQYALVSPATPESENLQLIIAKKLG
jgi:type IV pilus assembly protein PilF